LEVTVFSKEPAVLLGLAAAVVSAVVQAIDAGSTGAAFNLWTAVLVAVPLLAGVATRFNVVPAEVVRAAIDRANTTAAAVSELAHRVSAENPPTA
jgi:hypothetical protein